MTGSSHDDLLYQWILFDLFKNRSWVVLSVGIRTRPRTERPTIWIFGKQVVQNNEGRIRRHRTNSINNRAYDAPDLIIFHNSITLLVQSSNSIHLYDDILSAQQIATILHSHEKTYVTIGTSATIVVLDGDQRSALAAVRSLGATSSHRIIVGSSKPLSLASTSKYCDGNFTYPSPSSDISGFTQAVTGVLTRYENPVVLPMTELSSLSLLTARVSSGLLSKVFAPYDLVEKLSNKLKLIDIAENLDIPVPDTLSISDLRQFDAASTSYPLVLKPYRSIVRKGNSWISTAVRIAIGLRKAQEMLPEMLSTSGQVLLQRYVSGYGAGVFMLYDRGKLVASFAHQRIREKPPSGGVSTLSMSCTPSEAQFEYAKRLLDSVGWHGVAMVEFKVDEKGIPYLMEVNTRFWGSLQLAIDAGVDFPEILFRVATGQPYTPNPAYKRGVKLRWFLGDLDSLYITLRSAESGSKKLSTLRDFFTPDFRNTRHEVDRFDDPAPAWFEFKNYVHQLFRSPP